MKNKGVKDLSHKYSIWGENTCIWEAVKERERERKGGWG